MKKINRAFADLTTARDNNADPHLAWTQFSEATTARFSGNIPSHYRILLELVSGSGERSTLAILDHGCGSGRTTLILRALGFSCAQGIDLLHAPIGTKWNAWLPKEAIGSVQPFSTYDGKHLPFADATFDIIFSQQVIEHLPPNAFEDYFTEEDRVLKSGGRCYHQVPHRLSPYDSHSGTWFVHWLPRVVQPYLYSALGCQVEWLNANLHLRMPGTVKKMILKHIGPYENRTLDRVTDDSMLQSYDGNITLRRMVSRLGRIPVIRSVLAAFLMQEFVAKTDLKPA
jgi:SAM-dependent methyltransferase